MESPLAFATADAEEIAQALQHTGFSVTLAKDLNTVDMRSAIDEFAAHASNANVVLFYFAGHGVQVQNNTEYRNYLLPIDVSPSSPGNIIQNPLSRADWIMAMSRVSTPCVRCSSHRGSPLNGGKA
jgi:hypothetical protein